MDEKINDYIIDVVVATRDPAQAGMKDLSDMVASTAPVAARLDRAEPRGARPRVHQAPRLRDTRRTSRRSGPDVLRHRIILTYEAEAEEITAEQIVRRIFDTRRPCPDREGAVAMVPKELLKKIRRRSRSRTSHGS